MHVSFNDFRKNQRKKAKILIKKSNSFIKDGILSRRLIQEAQFKLSVYQIYDLNKLKTFVALKAEVENLEIKKLVNVSTSFNNLYTKEGNLDVSKSFLVDLKKLNNVLDHEAFSKKNSARKRQE